MNPAAPVTRVASVDDKTAEAYCRVVSDIATLTLRVRDEAMTALSANLLWEAIVASGERRGICWQMYEQSTRVLLADLESAGGPHDSTVLAAYVRLKAFVGDPRPSVDEADRWRPDELVQVAVRWQSGNVAVAQRKYRKR